MSLPSSVGGLIAPTATLYPWGLAYFLRAGAGMGWIERRSFLGSVTHSDAGAILATGFEFRAGSRISIGPEAHVTFIRHGGGVYAHGGPELQVTYHFSRTH